MSIDWVYPLDVCAANGILDYDAAADLLDQPARFVGNPKLRDLPPINIALLPEGTKMKEAPIADEFEKNNNDLVKNSSWKKWLFGGLAAAGITTATMAVLAKKGKLKLPNMTKVKSFGTKVWNVIKKPFVYIASKFKKTPTP